MNKPDILVIEDDNAVANLIAATLETQDYRYKRASTGAGGVMEALSMKPDVVLLDLGLPDMDGVDVIRKIRSWSNMPIIVVSARSEDFDKVSALRRVRYDGSKLGDESSVYENGELKIDYAAGCVFCAGRRYT